MKNVHIYRSVHKGIKSLLSETDITTAYSAAIHKLLICTCQHICVNPSQNLSLYKTIYEPKNWQENCQMQTFTLWPRQHFPACFYNILQYLQGIVLGLLTLWILQDCINARPCIRMLLQRRQHFLCHSLLFICTNRHTSSNISYEKHSILFADVFRLTTWPFGVTWHHPSRDHSIPHRLFPILWNQASISNGFRDIRQIESNEYSRFEKQTRSQAVARTANCLTADHPTDW